MKKAITSKVLPPAVGPYSIAVRAGDMIFMSGQIAYDKESKTFVTDNVEKETMIIMANIQAFLKEQQLDFSHIVKTTIFLNNMDHFAKVNEIYGKYFEVAPPARSCVAVKTLPKNVTVEIECLLYAPPQ